MDRARVLVADDEESMRFLMREVMAREGYEVQVATNGEEAVQLVREGEFDLAILDMKMPKMDGLAALKEIRQLDSGLIVLMMTAFGTKELALHAIQGGAYDYFTKPFELDEMRTVVRRALDKKSMSQRISNLEQRLRDRLNLDRIVGQSEAMRGVYDIIEKVVTNDVTVLITGESGTGKELVAQAVHYHSRRKAKPFISINCAAIPEALLESELFGHEKGAFTGAIGMKLGRFEAADGGSIFLDEIGEMPLPLQGKLLRALQEREVMRVGGNKPIKVDIRVIAATNRSLEHQVRERLFREDLFFRLNVLPIRLPSLRERQTDLPLLAGHFLQMYNSRMGRAVEGFTPPAMRALLDYPWPGNVRELENVVQRAIILAGGTHITPAELPTNVVQGRDEIGTTRQAPPTGGYAGAGSGGAQAALSSGSFGAIPAEYIADLNVPLQVKLDRVCEEIERQVIAAALEKAGNHRQDTADLLGISRKSLHNKMVKYQLFGRDGEATTGGDL